MADPLSRPPPPPVAPRDDGAVGGAWLFKQDNFLFGPVPGQVIVEKLYSGELNAETPIGREGQDFVRLGDVPAFVVHVAKAAAKVRVDSEAAREAVGESRRLRKRVIALAIGLVALAIGGVAAVTWHVKNRSLVEAELRNEIPIELSVLDIQIAAVAPEEDDELVEFVDPASPGKAAPARRVRKATKRASTKTVARAAARRAPKKSFDEEDITETSFDKAAIDRVLARSKGKLVTCLRQQRSRDPAFGGNVPFAFTIKNDGRVGRFWLDKPGYKTGPLYDCMKIRMDDWRFPAFEGEQPTVQLSFRIGS